MNSEIAIRLTQLPKGISFRKDRGSFLVKRSKKFVKDNGEQDTRTLTEVVKLGITSSMTEAEQKKQFETQVAQAVAVRDDIDKKLASRSFLLSEQTAVGNGTIKDIFSRLIALDTWKGKQLVHVNTYYKDTLMFFETQGNKDPEIKDMHDEFTLHDFKKWVRELIKGRPANSRQTVNNRSVNKRLGLWRMLTAYAIKKRLFSHSDCLDPSPTATNFGIVNMTFSAPEPKDPLSVEQEDQLLDTIKKYEDSFWWDCLVVAFDTGVRHDGELNRITTDNVNFHTKILSVKRQKTSEKGGVVWSRIPLTARALEVFKRRRTIALKDENNRYFPISKSSLRHAWSKYLELSGVDNMLTKKFTPYSTRHTYITRLVEAGTNAKVVQELAGHSSIETTLKYYTHATDDLKNEAVTNLQAYKNKKRNGGNSGSSGSSSMIGHNSRKVLK